MTIARPLRLLAAAALTAGLALPAGAFAAGHGHGATHHRGRDAHPRRHHGGSKIMPRDVTGVLTAMSATAAPATLTLRSTGGISITVSVAATTTVVRHYNGVSSLDELSVGDHLEARGRFASGSAGLFVATRLKDWSIQRADARVAGLVTGLASNGATLKVKRSHGKRDPYWHGEMVQLSFSSSTIVMSGSMTATVTAIQPGLHVMVMGTYDRTGRILSADRVRILGKHGALPPTPAGTATPTMTPAAATDTPTPTATAAVTSTATVAPTVTATPTA